MAQSHKDGSTVKDILHQFQSQRDGHISGKPPVGTKVQHSDSPSGKESKPMKSLNTDVETPGSLTRPSIRQIPKNVVNQKSRLFKKVEPDISEMAVDERQAMGDLEKHRKPAPPRRPPLAKKPPTAVDRKPRVIGPKPKLYQDKDGSSCRETEDGETSKLSSVSLGSAKSLDDGDVPIEPRSKDESSAFSDNLADIRDDIDTSCRVNKKSPGQVVSAESNACLYSKVDKRKKTKYQQSGSRLQKIDSKAIEDFPAETGGISQHQRQVESDLDESLGGEYAMLRVSKDSQDMKTSNQKSCVSPQPDRSQIPPKKPPRTFAHDDYMMQKQLKEQQKKTVRGTRKLKQHGGDTEIKPKTDEFGYEYVDLDEVRSSEKRGVKPAVTGEPVTKTSVKYQTIHRLSSVNERTKPAKLKQTLEKPLERPPPPPRPPPPSPRSTLPSPGVDQDRWKKPFVYMKEHNTKVPKTAFLAKGSVTNPSYEADWNIIRIKHPKSDGDNGSTGILKRCKSDECLYVEPDIRLSEPIYMDPIDAISNSPQKVIVDAEGYAIPEEVDGVNTSSVNHTIHRMNSTTPEMPSGAGESRFLKRSQNCAGAIRLQNQAKRKPVQDKLSKAYSVLRLNFVRFDDSPDIYRETKDDDSDNEVNPEEQNERLHYVSTIKLRLSMAVRQSPHRTPEELRMKLFNFAAIIGLEKIDEVNRYKTKSHFHFPYQTSEEIEAISQFCFPDLQVWRPVTKYKSETFSFVLTDERAKRRYGYCMRFLPPAIGNRLPIVLCIVSALDSFMFYKRLLGEIREKYKISPDHAELLVQAAYATPLPDPGKEAWVVSEGVNDKRETIFLKRPSDTRQDNVSFSSLLTCLSIDNLISVFASVLLERKIIFVAQHLSTLTSCIQAICALLYPFNWPHPFVPVLPEKMTEVCQSPTPIIVGVLTTQQPKLADLNLDHVLMIDLDHNTLMMCQGDESRIIPKKLQKALKLALKDDGDISTQAHDMLIMESFLRFFVETIGHYTEYICTQMDGEKIFEKKAFIMSVSSKSIHMFLEWFVETQMFEVFITDKMETKNTIGTFESRILEYREEMQETPTMKQNVKEMGRRVKNFFLTSGDKIRKKFSSNVFI